MTKALLVGPAPCLDEQLSAINSSDFEICCGINKFYNDKMMEILNKHKIKITHHCFSDYLYVRETEKINTLQVDNKIIIAPYPHMLPMVPENISICSDAVVQTINQLGGYGGSTWATTGMYSLGYLVYSLKIEHVKICGFTFGEGKLHLYDDTKLDSSRHSVNKEKQIFDFLNKKGKCTF